MFNQEHPHIQKPVIVEKNLKKCGYCRKLSKFLVEFQVIVENFQNECHFYRVELMSFLLC